MRSYPLEFEIRPVYQILLHCHQKDTTKTLSYQKQYQNNVLGYYFLWPFLLVLIYFLAEEKTSVLDASIW